MCETLFFICLGGIILTIFLAISGAIAGFAIIKTAQKSAPHITGYDVFEVTSAWAIGFGLGGLIVVPFLGIFIGADFIRFGFYSTIVFAIIGTSAGLIGVRSMFRRVAK